MAMMAPRRPAETTEQLRASLIEHARHLVARDGPAKLTMRSLAAEAGCALGLPYKAFADRTDLMVELVHASFGDLSQAGDELLRRVGRSTVAGNLAWFAEWLLDSPGVALAQHVMSDEALAQSVVAHFHATGEGPTQLESLIADYLVGEQRAGRVAPEVDTNAFGFMLAGAIHHLVVMGDGYPRPSKRRLERILAAICDRF
jgi:AcrR family transcriptional regulator